MGTEAAVSMIEWSRDLGDGRRLVMERDGAGRRASLAGFVGAGPTQEDALDALLARMQGYLDASDAFSRSIAPGGELHRKLEQIGQMIDGNLACPHCVAGDPSVWDDVLDHFAHPRSDGKLRFCHSPWRARCRRCSAPPDACSCAKEPAR